MMDGEQWVRAVANERADRNRYEALLIEIGCPFETVSLHTTSQGRTVRAHGCGDDISLDLLSRVAAAFGTRLVDVGDDEERGSDPCRRRCLSIRNPPTPDALAAAKKPHGPGPLDTDVRAALDKIVGDVLDTAGVGNVLMSLGRVLDGRGIDGKLVSVMLASATLKAIDKGI